MDPDVVFDCEKIVPNPYALALAAAARARALNRGAEPRVNVSAANATERALQEIASEAFSKDELVPFLPEQQTFPSACRSARRKWLRANGAERADAAPGSLPRETVH
jgi:DNA-directed RNA polymerase subunit omega